MPLDPYVLLRRLCHCYLMSQFHGYPTRSKISEKTKNLNTCPSCNFVEEISKLCYDLVGNFHDFQDEIIDFKSCNKKNVAKKIFSRRKQQQIYNTKQFWKEQQIIPK